MKRFERTLNRVLEVESVQNLRSQVLALVSMVAHFSYHGQPLSQSLRNNASLLLTSLRAFNRATDTRKTT